MAISMLRVYAAGLAIMAFGGVLSSVIGHGLAATTNLSMNELTFIVMCILVGSLAASIALLETYDLL